MFKARTGCVPRERRDDDWEFVVESQLSTMLGYQRVPVPCHELLKCIQSLRPCGQSGNHGGSRLHCLTVPLRGVLVIRSPLLLFFEVGCGEVYAVFFADGGSHVDVRAARRIAVLVYHGLDPDVVAEPGGVVPLVPFQVFSGVF
jgi:hypothetical protein